MDTKVQWVYKAIMACMISASFLVAGFAPAPLFAQSVSAQRAELEAELEELEREIAQQEALLRRQKQQTGSIQRDLDILRTEISQKKLEIEKKQKLIGSLSSEIREKSSTITSLAAEIEREKESLARILRNMYSVGSYSFTEYWLSGQTVSSFFADIDAYKTLQEDLQASFNNLEVLKERTHQERESLEDKKEREADLVYELEEVTSVVEAKEDEKTELFRVEKSKEKSYEQVLKEKKDRYDAVSTALFNLRGVSGGALQFGEAYQLAKRAGTASGIDPAFILAILKQETNFGANTGTCNRPGDSRTWRDIMPGPGDNSWRDDQTIYLGITRTLGIPPAGQPLSCPFGSGWGGAMGISQFIPATWATYAGFDKQGNYNKNNDRIRKMLGTGVVSNPWNNLHGITATSLYMKDLGAGAKTYTAEREAACKYYSGRSCSDPHVKNAFYGNSVMQHKITIQRDIDILEAGF